MHIVLSKTQKSEIYIEKYAFQFATQPRGNARQYHQRRLQPFNALLTPTGQLADGLYRHNDEYSALTKTLANKQTRFVRAADDAEESTAASQWFGENFGQMMQTLAQWMGLVINVIWKLFE